LINYLSKPIASSVVPYSENVGLIAQVANQKQNRYDNILSTIFQKQNQLLDLDTSQGSEEAEIKKDNLLKEADNQLNKFASSDLTIPDNISKIENIFSPIINDKDIMGAASITAFTKEQSRYFDEWKKEGKGLYNPLNQSFFLEQSQKNRKMTLKEVKEKGYIQPIATEFVDIDKEFREAAKVLGYNEESSVMGSYETGMYIITKEGKRLSMESILGVLPNHAGITNQAKINAWASMQNITAPEILNERLKINQTKYKDAQKFGEDLKENNKSIENNIQEIKNNSTKGDEIIKNLYQKDYPDIDLTTSEGKKFLLSKLEAKKQENSTLITNNQFSINKQEEYIQELTKTYGLKFDANNNVILSNPLDDDALLNLKTQYYLENKKMDYAKAFSKNMQNIKVEQNPYGVIQANFEKSVALKAIEDQYTKENKILDAELKALTGEKGSSSSGDGSSTENIKNDSKLIPAPAEIESKKEKYTYEGLQTEIKEVSKLVGTGDLGLDGEIAKSFFPQYSSSQDINEGKKEFEKSVLKYKSQMNGYTGDDNAKTVSDPHKTYGQVKEEFKVEKGYLDRRALLQAEVLQKQNFLLDISKKPNPSEKTLTELYSAIISKTLKQNALQGTNYSVPEYKTWKSNYLKNNFYSLKTINEKLKKYDLGSLTSKLVPRASTNEKDPARMLVQDAKNQIFSIVKGINVTNIQVKDFELKDGQWYVNYIDKTFIDTQESVPLSNEFVAKYANDFNVAAPIEIYKNMLSQKEYHTSGDEGSLPNKIIESPEIVIDGQAWKMIIDNSTPENMVRLGKPGQAPREFKEPRPVEDVLKYISGNSSSLNMSSNPFQQIREKYLPLQK
jgi:uncharacterized membrane-anchored protein YhcB (DUF1043 family)